MCPKPIASPLAVEVYNLGRSDVPRGRPVAGQLSDTPLCAWRKDRTDLKDVCTSDRERERVCEDGCPCRMAPAEM